MSALQVPVESSPAVNEHDGEGLNEPLLETPASASITSASNAASLEDGLRQRRPQQVSEVTVSETEHPRRLLDRDGIFAQSRGRWSIGLRGRSDTRAEQPFLSRFWGNWFYWLAYQKTIVLMLILFCIYFLLVVWFALIYFGVSLLGTNTLDPESGSSIYKPFCNMGIKTHMEALYFSLSTMTTIGYGVSDYYFGGCWTPLLLVLLQVCSAITFDAIAIGLLFQRFSRGHKRGKTVLCSDTAVLQRVGSDLYVLFRVAEVRRHHLLEATVRAYCVKHHRSATSTTHYCTQPLKLQHDETSSHILMSLPQVMVHKIDDCSPLRPPAHYWYDRQHQQVQYQHDLSSNGLPLFWRDREIEIVVIVEGTDELTGTTAQTRHSYSYQDIGWDRQFVNCVLPNTRGTYPACLVDFSKFHATEPAPDTLQESPYVAS